MSHAHVEAGRNTKNAVANKAVFRSKLDQVLILLAIDHPVFKLLSSRRYIVKELNSLRS